MALPTTNGKETTTTNATNYSLSSLSNLAKMLPTGVIFVFQILSNLLSGNGDCGKGHKILVGVCLGILGIVCFVLSFSDTFTDSNGKVRYGIATRSGMATVSSGKNKVKPSNESDYKLEFKDFLGAVLAVVLFAVVSLTDKNVVQCLYPSAKSSINKWVQALPVAVSLVTSAVFVLIPSKRQGISHPVTTK
jgi:hypothetical protein